MIKIIILILIFLLFNTQINFYYKIDSKPPNINNPWLLKALSTNTHTLLSDWYWLKSYKMGDFNINNIENNYPFFYIFSILNPFFETPIIYSSTYLAQNNRVIEANRLLQTARIFNKVSFDLYILEIMQTLRYSKNFNKTYLLDLTNKAYALPKNKQHFKKLDLENWYNDIVSYLENNQK